MQSNEELAAWVQAQQAELNAAEIAKGKNYMLPEPPKPGEYIYCRLCGKRMLPEDFNKDVKIRKKEFKWQMHWKCQQAQFDRCDRETPGLLAEREQGLRAGRPIAQFMAPQRQPAGSK